jgi:hypothetical protein
LFQKAYKTRLKAIHVLNVSPFMDAVVAIGKAIMKEGYRDRVSAGICAD